jgi:predicted nucleotidyltransferase
VEKWIPRDGDTLVTKNNFIFYVFGYAHPEERVFSFLKYIPSNFGFHFPLRFLKKRWTLGKVTFLRPEKLYTAKNFQQLLENLRNHFPYYVYFCPFRKKEVISVPSEFIKKVHVPSQCLQMLIKRKRKDHLQKLALELITLLSNESNVPFEDFGIHGSIALNMHSMKSDIDLVIYGSHNFRTLEKTIERLVEKGTFTHVFTKKIDRMRRHRVRYRNKIFVYNATRKTKEITFKYGEYKYSPVKPVTFRCQVVNDNEAMFRPAIYHITDYQSFNPTSKLTKNEKPAKVVSMIGCYRNVAQRGGEISVSGMLERVESVETGDFSHQVVVGTGTRENEYVWRLSS